MSFADFFPIPVPPSEAQHAEAAPEPFRPGPLLAPLVDRDADTEPRENQRANDTLRQQPDDIMPTQYSTVRETWRWLWKDTLGRVAPFVLVASAYARFSGEGAAGVGIRSDRLGRDLALGMAIGAPMAAIAAGFRAWVAPRYRLPTGLDQVLQTAFYFGANAPAEELFWRGTVQAITIRGLRRMLGSRASSLLGWTVTTAIFGVYHRLGGWSWRSIAGVTAAGGLFGATYLLPGRRSILAPVIIHGFATAGFLSWGDVALHWREERRVLTSGPSTPAPAGISARPTSRR